MNPHHLTATKTAPKVIRRRYVIALILALLLGFWATGRADSALAPMGLNYGDCYQVALTGSEICGDAAQHIKANKTDQAVAALRTSADTQASVRAAVPAAEVYYADHNTYAGLTAAAMHDIDTTISSDVTVGSATSSSYCIQTAHDGVAYHFAGPGGAVLPGAC